MNGFMYEKENFWLYSCIYFSGFLKKASCNFPFLSRVFLDTSPFMALSSKKTDFSTYSAFPIKTLLLPPLGRKQRKEQNYTKLSICLFVGT